MKKLCALLPLCALSLAAAVPVCAADDVTEYRIDEIGLTVEIPNDFAVFTREIDENDPALPKYGLTKDFVLSSFQEDNIYLSALNESGGPDVIIRAFENNYYISTEDEDDLLWWERFYTENVPGYTMLNNALYSAPQRNWCCFHYTITNDDQTQDHAISLVYATEASIYTFLYYSVGAPLPEGSAALMQSIVDSAIFDEDAENAEPNWTTRVGPFTYENEDFEISFRVSSGWAQYLDDTMGADEAYFYSSDNEMRYFTLDIYDYWAELSEEDQDAIDPTVIDTQYFLPNDLAALFGYPSGSFSRARYGDTLYFTGHDVYDQEGYDPYTYTFFITVHNGYIYWFEFEGTTDDTQFADVEQMLSSLTFFSDEPASAVSTAPEPAAEAEPVSAQEPDDEAVPTIPEPALTVPSALYWAIGLALAAILAIVLVHILRRQERTDPDSPRSVRDAEQRELDRRDAEHRSQTRSGPDLD